MGEMIGHIGSKNLLNKIRLVGPDFLEITLKVLNVWELVFLLEKRCA